MEDKKDAEGASAREPGSRRRFMRSVAVGGGAVLAGAGALAAPGSGGARRRTGVTDARLEEILLRCGSELGGLRRVR